MSGHSKWAGIKHKKAIVDSKRSASFTKIANMITVAVRTGGADIALNPSLKLAIEKGRAANMPKDNIERAIKRGTGELGGAATESLRYEGFGPGGVLLIVEALSDNRNRTNADIRLVMSKNGGRMADSGVAYQFQQRGVLRLENITDLEALEMAIIESDAEDYISSEGFAVVYSAVQDLHRVREQLAGAGFGTDSAQIEWVATAPVEPDEDVLERTSNLIEKLEDLDDVTGVFTNIAE